MFKPVGPPVRGILNLLSPFAFLVVPLFCFVALFSSAVLAATVAIGAGGLGGGGGGGGEKKKGDALANPDVCLVPASDVLFELLTTVRNGRVSQ
mgnify:CR=1 FL=1